MYAVGIDIGGTAIKIGVLDENGIIAAKTQIPTRQENKCGYVLSDAAGVTERLLSDLGKKRP